MVVNLVYISLLYILYIAFKHFVKIVPFFTTFQKSRNKSRKNTILKFFKKIIFAFFWLIYADILVSKQILIVPKRNKGVDFTYSVG